MPSSRDHHALANFFLRSVQAALTIDKARCQLIKNGLMRKSGELFEHLDRHRKGFITEDDLWAYSQEMHLSFSRQQIAFIFESLDIKELQKLTYKDFLDSLEPRYLLTDELALQLANGYDNPALPSEFKASTRLDFCIFLKCLYDQSIEVTALQEKLLDSRLSPIDYFRLLDPSCRCKIGIHDLCVFLEPYGSLGSMT